MSMFENVHFDFWIFLYITLIKSGIDITYTFTIMVHIANVYIIFLPDFKLASSRWIIFLFAQDMWNTGSCVVCRFLVLGMTNLMTFHRNTGTTCNWLMIKLRILMHLQEECLRNRLNTTGRLGSMVDRFTVKVKLQKSFFWL